MIWWKFFFDPFDRAQGRLKIGEDGRNGGLKIARRLRTERTAVAESDAGTQRISARWRRGTEAVAAATRFRRPRRKSFRKVREGGAPSPAREARALPRERNAADTAAATGVENFS